MTDYLTPRLERWRSLSQGPLLVLAIGSLPLLLLEVDRQHLPHAERVFLDLVNLAVLVAFACDFVVGLALTSARRTYARREWTSLAIVVGQVLALLPGLAGAGVLRGLRAVRVLRVVGVVIRVIAIGGVVAREGRWLVRRQATRLALGLAAFTWLTAAVAFTLAEDVGEGRRVHSFFDAAWWSASTITTVGYGDLAPVTVAGRLVGVFTMVVGILAFAIVTAKIAEFLVLSGRDEPEPATPDQITPSGLAGVTRGSASPRAPRPS